MKKLQMYAIVDNVAENVVSVFPAVNSVLATRMFKEVLDKNKPANPGDFWLINLDSSFDYPETLDDVNSIAMERRVNGEEIVDNGKES